MGSDSWISKDLLGVAVIITVLLLGVIAYFHQEAGFVQNHLFEAAHQKAAKSDGTLTVVGSVARSPTVSVPTSTPSLLSRLWARFLEEKPSPEILQPEVPAAPVMTAPAVSTVLSEIEGAQRTIIWKNAPARIQALVGDQIEVQRGEQGPYVAEVTGVITEGANPLWMLRANGADADGLERLFSSSSKGIRVRKIED